MRPRIRTLKPEMWQDERVVALSRDARLLLLGLVTMADDEGRFRARRSTILGHVFPGDADAPRKIDAWIAEVKAQCLVLFYVVDGTPYGAFRHWRRHQKINKPSESELPPPDDPVVVRDNSVPRKGEGTDQAGSATSSTRTRALRSDPDPVLSLPTAELRTRELCYRLGFRMKQNDPKVDPSWDAERWQNDMRLLVMDRGGGQEAFLEVERIIEWCQTDGFWKSNILSPGKLRKQFSQLALKSTQHISTPARSVSHLPQSHRPTDDHKAQVAAHLAAQRQQHERGAA